jgi:phosphoribosylaminoimidazole-succinocarboxamide synthase
MDEVLTPDSSRYWPAESYVEGSNPPSYDKQFLRDWLEQVRRSTASPGTRRPRRRTCRAR